MTKPIDLTTIAKTPFSREDILECIRLQDSGFKETQLRYVLGRMLESNTLIRVGRNEYELNTQNRKAVYENSYSETAGRIAEEIDKAYPLVDFRVWELRWLNEFFNHQIGQNKIFVEVENDACEYVYSAVSELIDSMVLYKPSFEDLFRYGDNDSIIITRLVKEAPTGVPYRYNVRLEQIIVDLFADKYLVEMLSKADYPEAIRSMFNVYYIDRSTLSRYAKRRNRMSEVEEYLIQEAQKS